MYSYMYICACFSFLLRLDDEVVFRVRGVPHQAVGVALLCILAQLFLRKHFEGEEINDEKGRFIVF